MPEFIQSWDLSVLTWMRGFNHPFVVGAAWVFSTVAWKGWLWWLIIGACWIKGQRDFAARVGAALAIAVLAGLPMKGVIGRARPDLYASQQLNISMPELLTTEHSFPSGHTLLAAAFAFVVFKHYKDYRAALAFAFVVVVGLARIHGGYHWPTDVIFSVVLGWVCALAAEKVCDLPIVSRFTKPAKTKAESSEVDAATKREKQLTKAGR